MLKVNDFFCGAGGMGLGFKYAGFRIAGAWDFDKYAVESYRNNVSPKVKQADITQMTWDEVPYADVWAFGFPCQDISVAGKKAGMVKGKTRSGLFYEVMRLLEETETHSPDRLPTVILAENVKAVKKYLPEIEKEYKARGYRMYATLYNSKYWGVPQNRERYFILGVHESIEKPFIFPEQQTDFIPKLSSVLEDEVDEKYYIDNEKAQKVIEQAKKRIDLSGTHACITPDRVNKRQNGRRAKGNEEEMFTLTAQDRHGVIDVVGRLDIKGQDNIRRVYNPEGISPTLTTSEGGNRQPKVLEPIRVVNYGTEFKGFADQSHCLLARDYKGFGNQEMNAVIDGFRVRRLTPREYARLQGFPESFEFHVSNTQLYKQFGNAVTVNVAQAIAEAIKDYLERD
jgi:DNA (cytosine-5)-methyltransferase 1